MGDVLKQLKPCWVLIVYNRHVPSSRRSVFGVIHLPDGERIITCSEDGSLRLWNLKNGLQIGEDWRDGDSAVNTIALSPDGKTVASGGDDGAVRLWDVATGKVIAKWTGHSVAVFSICWSQDGRQVLSGSEDGNVRVWDVESGKTTLQIEPTNPEHEDMGQSVCPVVYSPDETMIASGGSGKDSKKIKIWDAKTFELVATLEEPEASVCCLAWTKDGKTLISGSAYSGWIRKWNTTTWKQSAILTEQYHPIRAIAISPNDRILASASYDNTARLWNLENDQPISSPLRHVGYVFCVSFSADGALLATGCYDNNAYIWDVSMIVKEAGLDELLLDSDALQHPARKSVLDADATRRLAKPLNKTHIAPKGFFDAIDSSPPRPPSRSATPQISTSRPPSHSSTPQRSEDEAPPSSSRPRALLDRISSLFHRSHTSGSATSHSMPALFRLLNPSLRVSRRQNSDIDQLPPVVDVPCTRGNPRNVNVIRMKSPRGPNNVMTLNIPGTSRLPMSDAVQQSSEPVIGQQSSSRPQDLLTAPHGHAIVATTTAARTSLPVGSGTGQARGWTRFLCCFSPQGTANGE